MRRIATRIFTHTGAAESKMRAVPCMFGYSDQVPILVGYIAQMTRAVRALEAM